MQHEGRHQTPGSIQPEGLFDGLDWGCILRGALLDIALTFVFAVPLALALVGSEPFTQDTPETREAMERVFSSPEGLFWSSMAGLLATVIAAFYGARRAGQHFVRHGGWIAMASMVLGLPFLVGGGGANASSWWLDAAGLAAMLPAGLLGGLLASALASEPTE